MAEPVEQSCSGDVDCRSSAAGHCLAEQCVDDELARKWLCDDAVAEATVVRYSFHVVDFLTREPPHNLVVKACRLADVACHAPVDEYVDEEQIGHARLTLPVGFTGFFEITSDALPALLYVTKPIFRNTLERDLPVPTADTVELMASVTGYTYDPERGLVVLAAIDCAGVPSGGVHFKLLDANADGFYLIDQVPSREAQLTAYDASNNSADGGFLNVPPGANTFSVHWGVDGIELQRFNVHVRAAAITFVDMRF